MEISVSGFRNGGCARNELALDEEGPGGRVADEDFLSRAMRLARVGMRPGQPGEAGKRKLFPRRLGERVLLSRGGVLFAHGVQGTGDRGQGTGDRALAVLAG
jgi:hypothetical protein